MTSWTSKPGEDYDPPRNVLDDDGFRDSASHVIREFFNDDPQAFAAYIRITTWALVENAAHTGRHVLGSNRLRLVAVQQPQGPRLQVYFVIDGGTVWRRWVQVDPDWASIHAPVF